MHHVSPALVESRHDDTEARRLLQCAQGAFQKWPEDFAGFSAAIRCHDGVEAMTGEVVVSSLGVDLRVSQVGPLATWVRGALQAIVSARTPRFFKDGDGRFAVTFEPQDDHPLGRGVRVHLGAGRFRTYRIDTKGRIRRQENAKPSTRVTATYDGFVRGCPGRVLPTRIQILKWDMATQTVVETGDIEDIYMCRAHVWLPVARRATVVHGDTRRELTFELSAHVLLA